MPTERNNSLILPMILVCFGHFLVDVMVGIWPIFKTLAHVDLAIAGLLGGVCAFAGEGMQVVFGSWSDRGYRKVLILFGIAATSASAFLIYTDSIYLMFVLLLVTCVGSGAFHPCAASLVSELSPERRGLFISLFTSGGAFGMAFSQILYTTSNSWFHGHVGYLAVPAGVLVLFALLTRVGQDSAKVVGEGNPAARHFDSRVFLSFFRHPPLRNLYFTQVCVASLLWGTMFLLPDMLSSRGYDSWIAFGGGHMMFILGCAFMMIPAGFLADRFSDRKIILSATVMGTGLFYTLLFLPGLGNMALLALLFTLGASFGVVQPVAISLGTRIAPMHKGMISAFLMGMVWCISEGIGQIGGGFLATCFADDAAAKALSILGGTFVIGAAFAYMLPEADQIDDVELAIN